MTINESSDLQRRIYNLVRDCLLGKRNNNNKDINNTNNHKAIISKERFKAKRDLDGRELTYRYDSIRTGKILLYRSPN